MTINDKKAQRPRDGEFFKPENGPTEQTISDNRANDARPENNSFGKFKSLNQLLNAYNALQTQFTKRSQRLSEVIKENRALREQANAEANAKNGDCPQNFSENTNAILPDRACEKGSAEKDCGYRAQNMAAEDETGNAAHVFGDAARASRAEESDVYGAEAERFLKQNPSAAEYVGEIADKAAEKGDLSSGFLERAFIDVLVENARKNEAERENDDALFSEAVSRPAVYEKIIIKYLGEIKNKGAAKLIEAGLVSATPPVKPKSIEEAGAFAASVIKQKN